MQDSLITTSTFKNFHKFAKFTKFIKFKEDNIFKEKQWINKYNFHVTFLGKASCLEEARATSLKICASQLAICQCKSAFEIKCIDEVLSLSSVWQV